MGKAIKIPINASPVIIPELIRIPLPLLRIFDEIKPPINIGVESSIGRYIPTATASICISVLKMIL